METLTRKLKQGIQNWAVRQDFELVESNLTLAVSGGSDSVAMLLLFSEMALELKINLSIVHINHGIREEAEEDVIFVEKLAEKLNIPFHLENIELSDKSVEENARKQRYRIYQELGVKLKSSILLAHTADDQVETVIFNMFRGTGPRGLYGMPVIRKLDEGVKIFRPLMFATRKMLESFLKNRDQTWKQDYTNYDISYSRNYIRYNVIPNLLARFGEKSLRKVMETTDLQRELVDVFQDRVERLYISLSYDIYGIPSHIIKRKNMLMFGEALRQILQLLGAPLSRFNNGLVRRILNTLESRNIEIFENIKCEYFRGFLFVYRENKLPNIETFDVNLGSFKLEHYGDIIISLGSTEEEQTYNSACIAINSTSKLQIKNPSSGESFHPLRSSVRRFTQYARDKKIPRFLRQSLPVLYVDDVPAWTMGAGISHKFQVSDPDSLYIHAKIEGDWIELLDKFRNYL